MKATKKKYYFHFFSLQKLGFDVVVAILYELLASPSYFHRRYFEHIMHKYKKKSFLLSLDDNFKCMSLRESMQIIFIQIQCDLQLLYAKSLAASYYNRRTQTLNKAKHKVCVCLFTLPSVLICNQPNVWLEYGKIDTWRWVWGKLLQEVKTWLHINRNNQTRTGLLSIDIHSITTLDIWQQRQY
jgi:hypothetical protein